MAEWISPNLDLPHPDAEVLVCIEVNQQRMYRRAHCYFNQRGARYWDAEGIILYPSSDIIAWMNFPLMPE
jgi:hypothetical protein